MFRKILPAALLFFLISSFSYGQGNPFLSSSKEKNEQNKKVVQHKSVTQMAPSFLQKIQFKINKLQHKINKKLSAFAREIKENPSFVTFFTAFLFAFFYGLIHALGPGHGKVFAVSYFISEKAEKKKGILLGVLIAVLHVFSAVAIVSVLYIVVKNSLLARVNNFEQIIRQISYGFIAVIGFALVVINIRERK